MDTGASLARFMDRNRAFGGNRACHLPGLHAAAPDRVMPCAAYASVTQPSEAEVTVLMYLYRVPWVAL